MPSLYFQRNCDLFGMKNGRDFDSNFRNAFFHGHIHIHYWAIVPSLLETTRNYQSITSCLWEISKATTKIGYFWWIKTDSSYSKQSQLSHWNSVNKRIRVSSVPITTLFDQEMDFTVGHKYRLGKRIGRGAFGEIYYGTDITSSTLMDVEMTYRNECGY